MNEPVEYRSVFDFPVRFILYTTAGDFVSPPVEWNNRVAEHQFKPGVVCFVNRWIAAHPDGTIIWTSDELAQLMSEKETFTIVIGASETPGHPGESEAGDG